MHTLVVILICIGLVAAEFLGVAVIVAPRAVWRALRGVARATARRLAGVASRAREAVGGLTRRRGPGLGQGRLA